ncbi:MAG: Leu/Phe/Val dehydrogenase [Hyphomonadaceae bacterium]
MSAVFDHVEFDHHERIVFAHDHQTGLRAIIGIHSTFLGPAAGGVRMVNYTSMDDALTDVLRLSRGMSYKNALAGLPLGGGKAVLIGNPKTDKTPELMQTLGRAIEGLSGRYLAAEDVGMTLADMEAIALETSHVFGRDPKAGFGGEPSPMTALGVLLSIKTCVRRFMGRDDLGGVRIAVQGAGAVGADLARQLGQEGADVLIADVDPARAQAAAVAAGGQVVSVEDVLFADVDVLAPCALGAILNDATIPALRTKIVCGAANNQLAEPRHGLALAERGILYGPDYVVNAGGIINVAYEVSGNYDAARVMEHIQRVPKTLERIFDEAADEGLTPDVVADRMAQRLIGQS